MSIPLFLPFLFLFSGNAFPQQTLASALPSHPVARFELIHRHSPQLSQNPPKNKQERIKQLVNSDNARQQTISSRIANQRQQRQRRKAAELFQGYGGSHLAEIPLRSAADTGMGQYFVSFRIGSPPQKFVLIADTGSDMTWMNCKCKYHFKCQGCPKAPSSHHPGRIFQAEKSFSFKAISCLSEICKVDLGHMFSLSVCPTPLTPCAYDYSYVDGSSVTGIFVNETVTVGLEEIHRKIRLKDVIVGCSDWSKGSFHDADGVMGLGYGKHSFAVKAAKLFGNKFSYCLVDHLSPSNLANFLNFGNATSQTFSLKNMQHTQLILGVINPFYAVNVSGISVASKMLDIPSEVWNVEDKGGVIVDSGSTLAFLVQPAYLATMIALTSPLKNSKRSAVRSGPLEFCYEEAGFELELVPEFAWHFTDGAKFVPPVKSYVIDAAEGVKCFAFASAEWPGTSVIGNIMQQNHLWEFDLAENKLGFAPSTCTELYK